MKKNKYNIIIGTLTSVQVFLVLGVIALERLGQIKMGVARHLIFKNHAFESTLFTPTLMYGYRVILIFCSTAYFIFLLRDLRRGYSKLIIRQVITVLMNFAVLMICFTTVAVNMKTYYYLIIASASSLGLQYCKILMNRLL